MAALIGRRLESEQLRSFAQSQKSQFVAVYGRRRVGKTFLIRQTFASQFAFQSTGLANATMSQQLAQFHAALMRFATQSSWEPPPPQSWFEAFQQLAELVEALPTDQKKVIFLDELPWLDTQHSGFLSSLEHFWNSWASARDDILLIVCGSAAAWMINKLINNRGGLHNRITGYIKLEPFNLGETEKFLESKNVALDHYQIVLLYMVFGGIPYYLDLIHPGLSATQNINRLCFTRNAPFRREYDNLYSSLFRKHHRHVAVVEALAGKGKGLTRKEIIQRSRLSDGGGLTRILHELEESGFIRRYRGYGKIERESLYQLTDNYSLFYLRFIRNVGKDDEQFWTNAVESPQFRTWAGYSFEMVCLQHIPQIKKALGISGVQTSVSSWQSSKAQIDLLIDRKDQVINLCEMKFNVGRFTIDKKYAENLRNKVSAFRQASGTRKAIFLTMITTYGLATSRYSGQVQNTLTMEDLFESTR